MRRNQILLVSGILAVTTAVVAVAARVDFLSFARDMTRPARTLDRYFSELFAPVPLSESAPNKEPKPSAMDAYKEPETPALPQKVRLRRLASGELVVEEGPHLPPFLKNIAHNELL